MCLENKQDQDTTMHAEFFPSYFETLKEDLKTTIELAMVFDVKEGGCLICNNTVVVQHSKVLE